MTLQDIRSISATGSSAVFDYFDSDAYDPAKVAPRMQSILDGVRRLGEPVNIGFDPSTLGSVLTQVGFRIVEHLSPDDIQRALLCRTYGWILRL